MRAPAILALALLVPSLLHADCRFWRIERDARAIRLVSSPLPDGQTEVITPDGTSLVGVVVATGPGQSGDMLTPSADTRLITRCQGETLRLLVQRGAQAQREVMALSMAELGRWRVSVNVTGGDGVKARWRIERWATAAPEDGPVLDLFQGRIPIPANGHAVMTVVEELPKASASTLSGSTALQWVAGYPVVALDASRPWRAVFDLAAASTIVRRDALPRGVATRKATMRQSSADGVAELALSGDGAGGAVTGFESATLPSLVVGSSRITNVDVLVLAALPAVDGAPIDAILGLDILRRAGKIRLTHGTGTHWTLTFGDEVARSTKPADVSLPLRSAGALLGVTARVDSVETFLVLDSGSPHTVISQGTARRAGLALTPSRGRAPRGLDGRPLAMHDATVRRLTVGGDSRTDVAVRVADLPVLAKLGQENVGLLGSDLLSKFAVIEVDFAAERLLLWR